NETGSERREPNLAVCAYRWWLAVWAHLTGSTRNGTKVPQDVPRCPKAHNGRTLNRALHRHRGQVLPYLIAVPVSKPISDKPPPRRDDKHEHGRSPADTANSKGLEVPAHCRTEHCEQKRRADRDPRTSIQRRDQRERRRKENCNHRYPPRTAPVPPRNHK